MFGTLSTSGWSMTVVHHLLKQDVLQILRIWILISTISPSHSQYLISFYVHLRVYLPFPNFIESAYVLTLRRMNNSLSEIQADIQRLANQQNQIQQQHLMTQHQQQMQQQLQQLQSLSHQHLQVRGDCLFHLYFTLFINFFRFI